MVDPFRGPTADNRMPSLVIRDCLFLFWL